MPAQYSLSRTERPPNSLLAKPPFVHPVRRPIAMANPTRIGGYESGLGSGLLGMIEVSPVDEGGEGKNVMLML